MSVNSLGYLSGLTTDFTNVRAMGDFAVDGVLTVQNFSANSLTGHLSANTINAESGNTVGFLGAISTNTLAPASGNTLTLANGSALIHRSIDSGGQVLNVRAFGAVGDNNTDDADAIQSALSAVVAGGTVYFPPGQYKASTMLRIVKPSTRLMGASGGMFRANDTGADGDFTACASALVTGSSGMTLLSCYGADHDGLTIMQGGPVIENLGFFDNDGRTAGIIGTSTLLAIRITNRWRVQDCGFFFADRGIYLSRYDSAGVSQDNAWWTIDGCHFSACGYGVRNNAFTGRMVGGGIGSCDFGIYTDRDDVGQSAINGMRVQDIKFDIKDPGLNAGSKWSNGVGIYVGESSSVYIENVIFESQPNQLSNLTPSTTGVKINGVNNRVYIDGLHARQVKYGVNVVDAEFVQIGGIVGRTPSSEITMPATIRFDDVEEAFVYGAQAAQSSFPPILFTANTDKLLTLGYWGFLHKVDADDASLSSSSGPLQLVYGGNRVFTMLNTGSVQSAVNMALVDQANTFTNQNRFERTTGSANAIRVAVNTDSNQRAVWNANGEIRWGSGSATPEATSNIRRVSAGRMATDGIWSLSDGSALGPTLSYSSDLSLGLYRSGASTIAQSFGTFNLATNSVRLSMRTLAASAVTVSAANTNIATNEVVFTVGGASGASLAIHSGGTVYIFHSDISAKAT